MTSGAKRITLATVTLSAALGLTACMPPYGGVSVEVEGEATPGDVSKEIVVNMMVHGQYTVVRVGGIYHHQWHQNEKIVTWYTSNGRIAPSAEVWREFNDNSKTITRADEVLPEAMLEVVVLPINEQKERTND